MGRVHDRGIWSGLYVFIQPSSLKTPTCSETEGLQIVPSVNLIKRQVRVFIYLVSPGVF